ncbi:MAG TPA: amidohydrolase [Gemmobacter sp.]|nr:MAG: amidohydrolase [Rhodobacteraceae bacterium GWF1_65_7]HBD91017.1 amidohydrolase [Gemmobacter sp.]HBU15394.1 amidohydrolase [Gemmobacter sp.]
MLLRKLTGAPPSIAFPKGATDCQMHVYLPQYPSAPGAIPLPPDPLPTPEHYKSVMRWLGLDRVVVTQGNAHGHDNGNLLACLAELGSGARGVAVIDRTTSDTEIARLTAAGIVGARIMDLPGGAVGLDQLEEIDARAHAAGWMMAVQFDGSNLLDHLPRLERLKSRWVFDHHGKFFKGITADSPEVAAVLRLIDRGNCWFKFAGAYESSRSGWPFEDVAAPSRRIAAHAPQRIVWGTNFPHNMMRSSADYPDELRLAELAFSWLPDGTRDRVLTENPAELYGFPPS